MVVVDEAPHLAGPAAEIAALINDRAFWYLDQPVARVTGAHAPIPHSPHLVAAQLPAIDRVVDVVRRVARATGPEAAAAAS